MWAKLVGEVGSIIQSMGYGQQSVLHLSKLRMLLTCPPQNNRRRHNFLLPLHPTK